MIYTKDKLKGLIKNNELGKVIEAFQSDLLLKDTDAIILVTSRFHDYNDALNKGTLDNSEKKKMRNEIAESLLYIVKHLNDEIYGENTQSKEPTANIETNNLFISSDRQEFLEEITPPQYNDIELNLRAYERHWKKAGIKCPNTQKGSFMLSYCRQLLQLISAHRIFLTENNPIFAGYDQRVLDSINILKPLLETTDELFTQFPKINDPIYAVHPSLTTIKLALLNTDRQGYKKFHTIHILPLISQLTTLETLFLSITHVDKKSKDN